LVGVYDANPAQAEKIAKALDVRAFSHPDEVIGAIDLATVASSTQSHFEVGRFLIENGIHVNMEKPITANTEQAQTLIKMAESKSVILTVGHIERFNPAFIQWRSLMEKPLFLEFERVGPYKARGADVSVIHDLMIHDIDLLLSLDPGPIQSMTVQGARVLSPTTDWATVSLQFASGMVALLKASRVSPNAARVIRSFESLSHWTVNLGSGELNCVKFNGANESPLVSEQIMVNKVDALQVETNTFVETVLNHQKPPISGQDGMKALQLVDRICSELKHV
jgi:predicted dehydrogenase